MEATGLGRKAREERSVSRKQENLKRGKAEPESSGNRGLLLVLGAIGVAGVAILGYSLATGAFASAATEPVELDYADDPERLIEEAVAVEMGDPDAPVTLMEFADYQCPGCAHFATQIKPQLRQEFIETGQVHFVFHDFPLSGHANAFLAARAARCAGDQDVYWDYHDVLAARQNEWATQSDPRGLFTDYAEAVGADGSAFRECVNSDRHAETVTANAALGDQLGVTGTPWVLVSERGGAPQRVEEWNDYDEVAAILDSLLGDEAAEEEDDLAQEEADTEL